MPPRLLSRSWPSSSGRTPAAGRAFYRADVVDLWPRVLSITASGTPTQGLEQEANLAKAGVARELAAKVAGDAAIADLVAFLRAHDPDGAWFSGSNRARDLGLDDDLAIGLVVLAGEWEGSGARERQVLSLLTAGRTT
jgi:hypothetical protein